jgi:hypothetical protein
MNHKRKRHRCRSFPPPSWHRPYCGDPILRCRCRYRYRFFVVGAPTAAAAALLVGWAAIVLSSAAAAAATLGCHAFVTSTTAISSSSSSSSAARIVRLRKGRLLRLLLTRHNSAASPSSSSSLSSWRESDPRLRRQIRHAPEGEASSRDNVARPGYSGSGGCGRLLVRVSDAVSRNQPLRKGDLEEREIAETAAAFWEDKDRDGDDEQRELFWEALRRRMTTPREASRAAEFLHRPPSASLATSHVTESRRRRRDEVDVINSNSNSSNSNNDNGRDDAKFYSTVLSTLARMETQQPSSSSLSPRRRRLNCSNGDNSDHESRARSTWRTRQGYARRAWTALEEVRMAAAATTTTTTTEASATAAAASETSHHPDDDDVSTSDSRWGLEFLGAKRWNECVQAGLLFNLTETGGAAQPPTLLDVLCSRLAQGDAVARLNATDLSYALVSLSKSPDPWRSISSASALGDWVRACCRRLRKKSVRSRAHRRDVVRSLRASNALLRRRPRSSEGDARIVNAVCEEISTMAYTVANEVLLQQMKPQDQDTDPLSSSVPSVEGFSACMSTADFAVLWRTVNVLHLPSNDLLVQRLIADQSTVCRQRIEPATATAIASDADTRAAATYSAFANLATIASGLVRVHCTDSSSEWIVRDIGMQFRGLVEAANPGTTPEDAAFSQPPVRHVLDMLRCAALLHPKNPSVVEPFVDACRLLVCAESTFLDRCTLAEVSNLAWFLHRVQCRDRDMTEALARSVAVKADEIHLHDEGDEDYRPVQLACRILSVFTSLFGLLQRDNPQLESSPLDLDLIPSDSFVVPGSLSDLYELFGETILLSSHELSPRDLSSVVHAYAKSNYLHDMGIFDQLVRNVGSRVQEMSVRQLAQCLWACGRMMSWESDPAQLQSQPLDSPQGMAARDNFFAPGAPSREGPGSAGADAPPYLPSALAMAGSLAARSDQLTAQDVTQAVWALGHLLSAVPALSFRPEPGGREGPEYKAVLKVLAQRAKALNHRLSPREAAIILWSLGRISTSASPPDFDVVYLLTRRFAATNNDDIAALTPQECAMVLQAMARLDVRDADLFQNLSSQILGQVDDASAQSIAVAMRSHRAVHLSPPAALLNRWASRRLGMTPVPEEQLAASLTDEYDEYDDDDYYEDEYLSHY